MTKLWTRLYPIDIDRQSWEPVDGVDGLSEKVLVRDPENGSLTRYLRGDAGVRLPAEVRSSWEETFLLEGAVRLGDKDLPVRSFYCAPPGSERPELTSESGFVAIQVLDHNDRMDKPEVVLSAEEIEDLPWIVPQGRIAAHREKILAEGPSGSVTRLLDVGLDGDTTELDDHDFDEEVLILEGSVKNGEEFHPAGTYTFNGPHDTHGPFVIAERLLCYELRNYS